MQISGVSLISVRTFQNKGNMILFSFFNIPDSVMIKIRSTVQIIIIIILHKFIDLPINLNRSSADPVRTSSHGCPQKKSACFIFRCFIIAENHITEISLFVRHDNLSKRSSIVCYGNLHVITIRQSIKLRLITIHGCPKICYFHHSIRPFFKSPTPRLFLFLEYHISAKKDMI